MKATLLLVVVIFLFKDSIGEFFKPKYTLIDGQMLTTSECQAYMTKSKRTTLYNQDEETVAKILCN
jgi:hypothetical protein